VTVCLLVISDGRESYLAETLDSIERNVPAVDAMVHVDDTAHRLGFAGAVADGWRRALATGARWVLHVEQDFTFDRPVPLAAMIDVLDTHPYLVQMALLRHPINRAERRAGGIIGQHPGSYRREGWQGHQWLEHRRGFYTNPCVIPRWVLERGWPAPPDSERRMGDDLFAESPDLHAAYWGDGTPWVTHIGHERTGTGY
jgi:hypothetical protein